MTDSNVFELLRLWTRRELKVRYAGSWAGMLWALFLPLAYIGLFYFVFAVVLKIRIPELELKNGYFLYLLAGLLPWFGLSEGIGRAAQSLVAHESLLQKVVIPLWIFPTAAVLAAFLSQLFGMLILGMLLGWYAVLTPHAMLWLPLVLICQLAVSLGLGWILAGLTLGLRDLGQLVPIGLQFLFYATPILYPRSLVPLPYREWLIFNPFAVLTDAYHAVLLGFSWPPQSLVALLVWSALLGSGGWWLFRRFEVVLRDWL
ncbi:MAG: ABC transporter permease [Methylohalobius sp.]